MVQGNTGYAQLKFDNVHDIMPPGIYHTPMPDRFYLEEPLSLGPCAITGPEAHHLAQVLRVKPGAVITLFNGNGHEYTATIESVRKQQIEVTVTEDRAVSRERSHSLTVACPLPKGDRAQFLVEKLTELGVAAYIPLQTARSVVHPGEGKMDKLQRYVIEASKQCGRNVLMSIEPLQAWTDLVSDTSFSHCYLADATGSGLSDGILPDKLLVALGPEGGWTSDELALARNHHWQCITLGPSILRIETAALAAATLCLQSRRDDGQ
jgi:16S rRNA (uracil1498-N3)-methyltransferase